MSGHRKRINASPLKKAAVPLAFCLRAKKRAVFEGPIMMVRPMRKRICEVRGGVSYLRVAGEKRNGEEGDMHCPWLALRGRRRGGRRL